MVGPRDTSAATEKSREVRAEQKRDRERGRRMDETLLPQIESLNTHARANYVGRELEDVLLFIDMSREFHRNLNWTKKSIQMLDRFGTYEVESEDDLKFEERKFLGFYVDAWIHSMVELARKVHLSEELVQWWISTLERASEWFVAHPENLEWLDEINQELESRKTGKDSHSH